MANVSGMLLSLDIQCTNNTIACFVFKVSGTHVIEGKSRGRNGSVVKFIANNKTIQNEMKDKMKLNCIV